MAIPSRYMSCRLGFEIWDKTSAAFTSKSSAVNGFFSADGLDELFPENSCRVTGDESPMGAWEKFENGEFQLDWTH